MSVLESKILSMCVFHLVPLVLSQRGTVVVVAGGSACASHKVVRPPDVGRSFAFTADQTVILSFLLMIGLEVCSLSLSLP